MLVNPGAESMSRGNVALWIFLSRLLRRNEPCIRYAKSQFAILIRDNIMRWQTQAWPE
jgi:hypothetical protein